MNNDNQQHRSSEEEPHSLFVGELPKDCLLTELSDIFKSFGKHSIRIKHAKITRHPLGK
jgi:RNA recognition motif-containing protein